MKDTALMQTEEQQAKRIGGVVESGGLFGVWDNPNANRMTYFGLHALQHRGQSSVGIVTSDGNQFYRKSGEGIITRVFANEKELDQLLGQHAIGQVRSATSEDFNDDSNVQPLLYHFNDQSLAIAQTGNITNSFSLRDKLEQKGAIFASNSAAEIIVHLIRQNNQLPFRESLEQAIQALKGGFNFCILTEHGLYGAVDRKSYRPLIVGQLSNGSYILASETCVLSTLGASFVTEVLAGEYIEINDQGYQIYRYADETEVTIEPMEFIYFARPDSNICALNVHSARKSMGRRLAKEAPAPTADFVIGVPNSSLSAASGYAEAIGLPYEMGLIKHQYIGRTFIQPTQALREQGVSYKLSVVPSIVNDARIVLVDDSIVRGTTVKWIIKLLREAGAKEIHLRIASPPIRFPNYYGINTMDTNELIAARYTVSELNTLLGSDSLAFLSVEGMLESVNFPQSDRSISLSTDAFKGKYASDIADYQSEFVSQLTDLQKEIMEGRLDE